MIDFSTSPEVVRVVAEGERLAFGHLVNPAFAVETALIDPLPHQRIAVYQHLLPQTRLRFLLADDAWAGKTIMAGLYIREMLVRRLIRRVLVVPPAGLVGNWESELAKLFGLSFHIAGGSEARAGNPFIGPRSDRLIVSVDTLSGDKMFQRLREPAVEPYDLVIFDECHKLAADRLPDFTIRRAVRYKLAEALAGVPTDEEWSLGWSCHHVLLLSATPHMGKDYPYYALWRLLEPDALATVDAFHAYPADARQRHFIRRTKEEMVRFDGTRIYPRRLSDTLSYDLTQGPVSEQTLYDETTDYIQTFYNRARILNRSAARLAMSVFQRRLASSTLALLRSFERRVSTAL
jgi:SNF2 family DNA or RNA helicase